MKIREMLTLQSKPPTTMIKKSPVEKIIALVNRFIRLEYTSGILLLTSVITAIIWENLALMINIINWGRSNFLLDLSIIGIQSQSLSSSCKTKLKLFTLPDLATLRERTSSQTPSRNKSERLN